MNPFSHFGLAYWGYVRFFGFYPSLSTCNSWYPDHELPERESIEVIFDRMIRKSRVANAVRERGLTVDFR